MTRRFAKGPARNPSPLLIAAALLAAGCVPGETAQDGRKDPPIRPRIADYPVVESRAAAQKGLADTFSEGILGVPEDVAPDAAYRQAVECSAAIGFLERAAEEMGPGIQPAQQDALRVVSQGYQRQAIDLGAGQGKSRGEVLVEIQDALDQTRSGGSAQRASDNVSQTAVACLTPRQ